MLRFDFPHIGAGRLHGVGSMVSKYLLVIAEGVNGYVWLELAATCTAAVTAKTLLRWCGRWVPCVWVSDTARHVKNRLLRLLTEALEMSHRFTVANAPWTHGTMERMML